MGHHDRLCLKWRREGSAQGQQYVFASLAANAGSHLWCRDRVCGIVDGLSLLSVTLVNVWSTHECVPLRTLIRPNPVRSVESSLHRRHFKGLPVILLKSNGSKGSVDSAHNLKSAGPYLV
ncbi:hypothetical protein Pden_3126 [Paracoccus denitrificans PD1222]|uniref:Uncharacterized protein n=1 Tax=Paracoccus denitrificans (strain Pd 1222) TaxID=318586 RepID=A1B6R3_PARDP|nr:hypothetical protein Pden_3126 [Paracoccus denitrificans PD1222]